MLLQLLPEGLTHELGSQQAAALAGRVVAVSPLVVALVLGQQHGTLVATAAAAPAAGAAPDPGQVQVQPGSKGATTKGCWGYATAPPAPAPSPAAAAGSPACPAAASAAAGARE